MSNAVALRQDGPAVEVVAGAILGTVGTIVVGWLGFLGVRAQTRQQAALQQAQAKQAGEQTLYTTLLSQMGQMAERIAILETRVERLIVENEQKQSIIAQLREQNGLQKVTIQSLTTENGELKQRIVELEVSRAVVKGEAAVAELHHQEAEAAHRHDQAVREAEE